MNQLTERNLQMWKEFQNNLAGSMGTTVNRPKERKEG
jgi:hypothetical protein